MQTPFSVTAIFTPFDTLGSRVQAVAIKDGKFIKVGSNDDMKAVTGKDADMIVLKKNLFKIPVEKIIDTRVERTVLKGKTVYPRK